MKPVQNLGETKTPNGSRFSLHEHDGEFFFMMDGAQLMCTRATLSERLLADLGCPFTRKKRPAKPRVLIGGLGLGYSLARVLEIVGMRATVVVAELLPDVVRWNREFLQDVNGKLLDDPRVEVFTGDVNECIRKGSKDERSQYHAILLDVDNGPTALVQPQNRQLYDPRGLAAIKDALRPGGRVAFWAATKEPKFVSQLEHAGFQASCTSSKAHERAKREAHWIYVGHKQSDKE